MSRSIGDFELHKYGVISEPDIYELDLKEKNVHAVLFGSDGLTTCYGADSCFARMQSKPSALEGLKKLVRDCYKDSYESSKRIYTTQLKRKEGKNTSCTLYYSRTLNLDFFIQLGTARK